MNTLMFKSRARLLMVLLFVFALILAVSIVSAHPDEGEDDSAFTLHREDPSAALIAFDASYSDVVSEGPSSKVIKNLDVAGRGERLDANSTTDVWTLGNYAYTGTFSNPCGGDPGAGVWIWDVTNSNKVEFTGIIPSPTGSRSNDVKVAAMNSGDILVHSNESCNSGPGGFEIYNVDDPRNPVHLSSVTINEDDGGVNVIPPLFFAPGELDDVGVHNLFLFTQGSKDYVAAVAEGVFDNFRIYEIVGGNAVLKSGWGAEELVPGLPTGVSDYSLLTLATGSDPTGAITLNAILDLFSGFGASQNKFLHDVTISADGTRAYLSNWDAGLVLLDISDPTNPSLVSVALDVANGSLDGEVNSHAAWPNEDGSIVVEGEEDFATSKTTLTINTGPNAGGYSSAEGAFTTPIISLPGQQFSGATTYVGLACNGGPAVPAGSDVALIQRGVCRFDEKATNAINAGYTAMVVFNDAARDLPGREREDPGER